MSKVVTLHRYRSILIFTYIDDCFFYFQDGINVTFKVKTF